MHALGSRQSRPQPGPANLARAKPTRAGLVVGHTPLFRLASATLTVGASDDEYEREASRAAEQVTAQPGRLPERPQAKTRSPRQADQVDAPASVVDVVTSSGQPLDRATRAFFEMRFGSDFSRVRVHSDAGAAQSARDVSAEAYTSGQHMVFAVGRYAPDTHDGRRLMAHELAHVVQQSGANRAGPGAPIQRQAAPSPQAAPPPPAEGDKLRAAVLHSAETWLEKGARGEAFISQTEIDDIRSGVVRISLKKLTGLDIRIPLVLNTPVPNFTTCVEFAGRVFKDAAKAELQGDPKAVIKLARLLPRIFTIFNEQSVIKATIEALGKGLHAYDKPTQELEDKRAKQDEEIAALEHQHETLDPKQELRWRQQRQLAGARLKQFKAQLNIYKAQKEKLQKQIDEQAQKFTDLEKKGAAAIKPQPGMAGGRPKPGEFVLLGYAPGGSNAIPGGHVLPSLPAGSFKHICVLQSIAPVEEGLESWTTIDGGGTTPTNPTYYVRLSDLLVFLSKPPLTPPAKPGTGVAPLYMLLGWIDTDALVGPAPP